MGAALLSRIAEGGDERSSHATKPYAAQPYALETCKRRRLLWVYCLM